MSTNLSTTLHPTDGFDAPPEIGRGAIRGTILKFDVSGWKAKGPKD